ncbi:alcohol dehydrogenase catalytic domain-containing protein [Pseudomonas sp. NPDC090203]|uniref:alcohol dehydrogenase catalytic domain-containing protein n=1 Tax=Pseudomonas sp. NPDC090203 TaxID=3364477 RepID=UPI003823FDC7
MKAFQIGTQQGLDSLTAIIRPEPVAGPGEVILAPRMVSLISRDVQILRGVYGALQAPERVPVSEGVGEVVAVGEGVSQVQSGDRVICGHFPSWLEDKFSPRVFAHDMGVSHEGWLAEKVVLPAAALTRAGCACRCRRRCAGLGRADGLECTGGGVQGQAWRADAVPWHGWRLRLQAMRSLRLHVNSGLTSRSITANMPTGRASS